MKDDSFCLHIVVSFINLQAEDSHGNIGLLILYLWKKGFLMIFTLHSNFIFIFITTNKADMGHFCLRINNTCRLKKHYVN